MTCREFENLLHPYVDDEFDAAEKSAAESHLASCNDCSRRVFEERRFRHALREAVAARPEQIHAPDSLRVRIREGIRLEQRRRLRRRALRYSAVAAVLAVALSATYSALPKRRERFVLDAARSHARPLPAEINAHKPEDVEAWFGGKFDHRVSLPRLRDAQVAGARILNVQDRPAAYIRYHKADPAGAPKTIGLFVFGDQQGEVEARPLPSVEVDNRLGYNVAIWREGEIVYQMVTDLDERAIRALLDAQDGVAPRPGARNPDVEVRPVSIDR